MDDKLYRIKLKHFIKINNLNSYKDVSPQTLKQLKKECYILSEAGLIQYLGDEKHILHYGYLEKLYENVYYKLNKNMLNNSEEPEIINNIIFYHDEKQAEIWGTQNLRLREKIILHNWLIRLINLGINPKEAVAFIFLLICYSQKKAG